MIIYQLSFILMCSLKCSLCEILQIACTSFWSFLQLLVLSEAEETLPFALPNSSVSFELTINQGKDLLHKHLVCKIHVKLNYIRMNNCLLKVTISIDPH